MKKTLIGLGIAVAVAGYIFVQCIVPAKLTARNCDTVMGFMRVTNDMNNPENASSDQANAFRTAVKELAEQNSDDVQYGPAPAAAAKLIYDIDEAQTAGTDLSGDQVAQIGKDADALVEACKTG